jgi:hypothetical protein
MSGKYTHDQLAKAARASSSMAGRISAEKAAIRGR